eukprot:TRINITY_DN43639_c0_g3_i2.p1 TRINITY_DN43639_c0_g3~~TRINITY_DN43639_c0_g3_i2.p1  ORF type:complete len:342 (-),score=14.94 TRINITY_DN43639_c0_g3_i2:155-1180(-)
MKKLGFCFHLCDFLRSAQSQQVVHLSRICHQMSQNSILKSKGFFAFGLQYNIEASKKFQNAAMISLFRNYLSQHQLIGPINSFGIISRHMPRNASHLFFVNPYFSTQYLHQKFFSGARKNYVDSILLDLKNYETFKGRCNSFLIKDANTLQKGTPTPRNPRNPQHQTARVNWVLGVTGVQGLEQRSDRPLALQGVATLPSIRPPKKKRGRGRGEAAAPQLPFQTQGLPNKKTNKGCLLARRSPAPPATQGVHALWFADDLLSYFFATSFPIYIRQLINMLTFQLRTFSQNINEPKPQHPRSNTPNTNLHQINQRSLVQVCVGGVSGVGELRSQATLKMENI